MTLADGNIYIVAKGSISEYQHFCHIQKAEKLLDFSVIFIFNRGLSGQNTLLKTGWGRAVYSQNHHPYLAIIDKDDFNSVFIWYILNVGTWHELKTQERAGAGDKRTPVEKTEATSMQMR